MSLSTKVVVFLATIGFVVAVVAACGDESAAGPGGATCATLCDREPAASQSQKDCVSSLIAAKYPAVLTNATCSSINSPASCKACYSQVSIANTDCATAEYACF